MVNTFFTDCAPLPSPAEGLVPEDTSRRLVSEMSAVRAAQLWRTPSFWEETVFEVLSKERARLDAQQIAAAPDQAATVATPLQEQVEQEQNVAFGQISAVLNLMLELGSVPVDQAAAFCRKVSACHVRIQHHFLMT